MLYVSNTRNLFFLEFLLFVSPGNLHNAVSHYTVNWVGNTTDE